MSDRPIDLRSDTVTRPTPAMRAAMAAAEVGDDVFGDDPTVNRLQERLAEMLDKEAALYVPSGTMSNQIAVRLHCQRGDELICESQCHIFNYEQGGAAQLSGVSAAPSRESLACSISPKSRASCVPTIRTVRPRGSSAWKTRTIAAAAACCRSRTSPQSAIGHTHRTWPRIWMARGYSTPSWRQGSKPHSGPSISTP